MSTAPLTTEREETSSYGHQFRVLSVIPAGSSKASMIFARRQVTGLQRAGVACETFFLASRTSPWTLMKEGCRLREAIHSFRPDVLHAHYGTMTAFLTIAVSTRIPVVVTYRGSDLNPDPTVWRGIWLTRQLTSEIVALCAAQIICVSEELRDRLWWRKSKAAVIPTGIDTDIFYPRSRIEARSHLGWRDGERVVLFNAGSNPIVKRASLAQAAVEVARKKCGNIRFTVLDGNVAPNQVPVIMSAADCLLVTSEYEGSPNVVKEAMASNLPVVTVDVGDVRLRLEGVSPSHIVRRSPEDLGNAVADVLMHGLRSNGSSKIADLSDAATIPRIMSVYSAAVRKQPASKASSTASTKI